ncbi:metallophosphoesterase [Diaphorobacter aerolatus]|uniref:Metallophosphoesterase n=1 Tax=Diaphorobacter aerolatus TaxID=1288495 RepID=A0A7H0GHK2_9BURK|nr:metallophosphoesterase [Diaphorobacter aerolatus]QNP47768.1 metallophosphoesterase [Diaphorobacter aerolatus]
MSSLAVTALPTSSLQLVRFSVNRIGRDIAVGDIHGCFSALQSALSAIDFDPLSDRLFSVGDLVDRGPESHRVIEWLDKPWFHAICGNHEQMVCRTAGGNPLPDVDHMKHGGEWMLRLSECTLSAIVERLAALPLAFEVQTGDGPVGLVHAGYPFEDWDDIRSFHLAESAIDCCLWSRDRYARRAEQHVANVRAVIHGHTTVNEVQRLGNTIFIDTGGWRRGVGHFTLLDLQTLAPVKARMPTITQDERATV